MSTGEIIIRVLSGMKPILPGIIAAVIATLIALVAISILGRRAWVGTEHFSLPSLFFGLNTRGIIRLACTWLKLVFLIIFFVSFQKMVLIQYLMIVVPSILLALLAGSVSQVLGGFLWSALQLVGLVCGNLVCGYIIDMAAGVGFYLVYIAISLFMILFSVYLFLLDLMTISQNRTVDPYRIWRITDNEDTL